MSEGVGEGAASIGPPSGGARESARAEAGGEGPEVLRDRLRPGSRPRILNSAEIDRHERVISERFAEGDPAKVWAAVRAFIRDVRAFSNDAARDRFAVNFGSSRCEGCEGLKAGPDVVATCFQLKQCFYTNKKSIDASRAQKSWIEGLSRGE